MESWFSLVVFAAIIAKCSRAQTQEPAAIVVRPPALTTAIAGQTVRLTCVAYGFPLPNITWTSNNLDLADKVVNEAVTVNETSFLVSILQLCDLTSADMAEYTCTADNGVLGSPVASNVASFILSVSQPVTEPPAIVVQPPDMTTVDVNSTVEMVCVAYGNPIPTVIWSRPGCSNLNNTNAASNVKIYSEFVTTGNVTFQKSVLQICGVKAEDDNQYTCTAENGVSGIGQANPSASFQVRVVGTTNPTPSSETSSASEQVALLTIIAIIQGVIILFLLVVILVIVIVSCLVSKKKSHYISSVDQHVLPLPQIELKEKTAESDYATIETRCGVDRSVTTNTSLTTNPAYGRMNPKNAEATYESM